MPEPSSSLDFNCPLCAAPHRVPLSQVPVEGRAGRCSKCGRGIFMTQAGPKALDGEPPPAAVSEPISQPTALAPPPIAAARYRVRTPDGQVAELDDAEIVRQIRSRKILPFDQVSTDGEFFAQARDYPELAKHIGAVELPPPRRCANHPAVPSATVCTQCSRGYCVPCGEAGAGAMRTTVPICAACGAPRKLADRRWTSKPFWEEPKHAFLFPLVKLSWVTTGGVAMLLLFGGLLFPVTTPLYLIGLAWIVNVVGRSSRGAREMGTGPDFSDPSHLISRGLLAAAVSVACALPSFLLNLYVIVRLFGDGGIGSIAWLLLHLPIAILSFCYYPMALGMVAVWHDPWIAFKPHVVIAHILKIKFDYTILLCFGAGFAIVSFAARLLFGWIPLVGSIPIAIVEAYCSLAFAHMLGWTLYMNEDALGWG